MDKTRKEEGKRFMIPFYDQNIVVVKIEKEIVVPMRRLCDNLGISWSAQFERIRGDPVLKEILSKIKVISKDNKSYNAIVLPLNYLQRFLYTINLPRFVLSEQKSKIKIIVLYQEKLLDHINNYLASVNIEVCSQHSQSKLIEVMLQSLAVTSSRLQPDLMSLPKSSLEFLTFKGFIYVIRLVNNNLYVGCSKLSITHRFRRHSVLKNKTFLYFEHIFFVKNHRTNVYDVEKRLHMALSKEIALSLVSIRGSGSFGFSCSNQNLVRALFYAKITEEAFIIPSLKVIKELSNFVKGLDEKHTASAEKHTV